MDAAAADAIKRRYPKYEVRALVAEIRRLNGIATFARDLVRALELRPDLIGPQTALRGKRPCVERT